MQCPLFVVPFMALVYRSDAASYAAKWNVLSGEQNGSHTSSSVTNQTDPSSTSSSTLSDQLIHSPQKIPVYGQLLILVFLAGLLSAFFYFLRRYVIATLNQRSMGDPNKHQMTYRRKRTNNKGASHSSASGLKNRIKARQATAKK